jgi:GTP pyrophosphokinase
MSRLITNLTGVLTSGATCLLFGLAVQVAPAFYPIALWRAFCLLEDLLFFLRHPRRYRQIRACLGDRGLNRERMVRLAVILHARLAREGIRARIHGRCKRVVSIHRKMALKGLELAEIHDVRALRIIVPDVATCYHTLTVIQRLFPTLRDRGDDYIAHPKPNGYRSLHATILDQEGLACEVQVRTPAMHQMAECGSAAHWRYKVGCLRVLTRRTEVEGQLSPAGKPQLQTDN